MLSCFQRQLLGTIRSAAESSAFVWNGYMIFVVCDILKNSFKQFLFIYNMVFVCFISSYSSLSSFWPSVFMMYRIFILLVVVHVLIRWFAKVDSVVECNAFTCSLYLCLNFNPSYVEFVALWIDYLYSLKEHSDPHLNLYVLSLIHI